MKCLPRKATYREWYQPNRKMHVAGPKAERVELLKAFGTGWWATGFGTCPPGFWYRFDPIFPHYDPFLHFGVVPYILCCCRLKEHSLLFILHGITVREFPWVSEQTLVLGQLSSVETVRDFWSWIEGILHHSTATGSWASGGRLWEFAWYSPYYWASDHLLPWWLNCSVNTHRKCVLAGGSVLLEAGFEISNPMSYSEVTFCILFLV